MQQGPTRPSPISVFSLGPRDSAHRHDLILLVDHDPGVYPAQEVRRLDQQPEEPHQAEMAARAELTDPVLIQPGIVTPSPPAYLAQPHRRTSGCCPTFD